MWETNDEKTKLARVVVNFDSVLDDVFKINISKQIVQLPPALQAEIKKIADVARKDSQRKYRNPAPKPPPLRPPVTGPGPANGGVSVFGGGPAVRIGLGPTPAPPNPLPPSPPPPRFSVKDVKTEKFIWKLSKGLTGAVDLQVSDAHPGLAALVKRIRSDQVAVAHLASFLGSLDEADVQKALLAEKVS
jgi:hypothetical protein